jgi:hypothetical protein
MALEDYTISQIDYRRRDLLAALRYPILPYLKVPHG